MIATQVAIKRTQTSVQTLPNALDMPGHVFYGKLLDDDDTLLLLVTTKYDAHDASGFQVVALEPQDYSGCVYNTVALRKDFYVPIASLEYTVTEEE